MMYQLDHIVHFVEKPEQAITDLQKEGLHVVIGGKHDMWGTYNALSYFDLTYIECIGIFDELLFEQAAKESYSLHASFAKRRELGLTRFAISTTTIAQDAKKFAEAGFDVMGPTAFSRTRTDGSVVTWQLLYIGHPTVRVDFPFFIQWEQEDDERRHTLKQQQTIAKHAAGDLQLAELHVVVPNLEMIGRLARLCDTPIEKVDDIDDNVNSTTVILSNAQLVFHCPTGEGDAWDYMLHSGYGIQKLVLTGANEDRVIEYDGAIYELRR